MECKTYTYDGEAKKGKEVIKEGSVPKEEPGFSLGMAKETTLSFVEEREKKTNQTQEYPFIENIKKLISSLEKKLEESRD